MEPGSVKGLRYVAIDPGIASDRKIMLMARALKKNNRWVAGCFPAFFGKVAEHAPDGNLSDVIDQELDEWAGNVRGFGALVRRLLCDKAGVLQAWEHYNGASLVTLGKNRVRVAEWRKAQKEKRDMERQGVAPPVRVREPVPNADANEDGNANSTMHTVNRYHDSGTKSLKTKQPSRVLTDAEGVVFDRLWAIYPKRSGNNRAHAQRLFAALLRGGIDGAAIVAGATTYAAHIERRRRDEVDFRGTTVQMISTFLGPKRGWEAEWGPAESEKIWPYVDDNGVPGPEGNNPNPAFPWGRESVAR